MLTFLKSKKFYVLIILIAVATIGYFLLQGEEGVQFETEKIEIADIKQIVDVNGTVESNAIINLRFQRTGKLENINYSVGDQVIEGAQLAKIEDKDAQIEVDRQYAGVKLAKAELNLKYAGPSYEEIIVSETKIKEAQVNLVNSEKRLNDVYLTSAEAERNAELQVEKAKIALENAEKALENAKESSLTTQDIAELDLSSTYQDSQAEILNSIDEVNTSISVSDSILGEDDKTANDAFDQLIDDVTPVIRAGSITKYEDLKLEVTQLRNYYDQISSTFTEEETESALDQSEAALFNSKKLLDQVYDIVNNFDITLLTTFTSSEQETLKNKINTQQAAVTTQLAKVLNLIQTIENAKLGISSTQLSTTSSLDDAKAALAQAEKDLEIAENNLESILIENKIAEHNAQMEIDINDVRLQQARANHNQLIATPRWVDVA